MIEEVQGDFLQWLRGFYYVAQRGSVTQAALSMGREQPTITRQIKCLEKQLGVALFDRSTGTMKLTVEGKALLDKVIPLFDSVQEIRDEFRQEPLEYQGKIFIAASHAIVNFFLPPYVASFLKTHPNVSFHIEGNFFQNVYEKVESGESDFGIAFADSAPSTVICHDLFESGQKLITLKGSSYFPDRHPTLRQIAAAPLILFSRTGSLEPFIQQRFAEEGLTLRSFITHNNFVSVKTYVAMGLGVAILTGHVVTEQDRETLDIYDLDEYFPKRRVALLIRKRKHLSPAALAFLRTIKMPDIPLAK
ncbi:MAG: LysR family transcriptional regulator [Syntrophaceae bacterium]|nr:LysR family transcriptional regulator [Syntrophaceae bacterium]